MIDATDMKIHQANEVYKVLKNVALIINYDESQEVELKGWVKRTFNSNNVEIRDDALNLFMQYLNNNQIRMEQEIEKLVSYVGSGGVINTDIINLLINKDLSNEIFNG